MTEREALDALRRELPPDAIVDVCRYGSAMFWPPEKGKAERHTGTEHWQVHIHHVPSGYIRGKVVRGDTAEEAIANALAKWRKDLRRAEREGLPRYVCVDTDEVCRLDYRVRLSKGRLFCRSDEETQEVEFLLDCEDQTVTVSSEIPPERRRAAVRCVREILSEGKAEGSATGKRIAVAGA